MKKVLFGVAAAALLVPAGANADWNYTICAPGAAAPAYTACASANVSFMPTVTGGQILLKVKNTGLFYNNAEYNTWGYAITGIGIEAPTVPNPDLVGVSTIGAVENVGNAQNDWNFSTNIDGFFVEAGASSTGANGGIWGCYGTAGGSYFRTCGDGEWVQFAFSTSATEWAPAEGSRVWLAMRGQSGYEGDSYRCSDDPAASNGADCYFSDGDGGVDTTTPEPISLVLLGSGLLGLAGVRSRRRRS